MCRFEFLTFPNYNSISFSVIWKKVFSSPGYQVQPSQRIQYSPGTYPRPGPLNCLYNQALHVVFEASWIDEVEVNQLMSWTHKESITQHHTLGTLSTPNFQQFTQKIMQEVKDMQFATQGR